MYCEIIITTFLHNIHYVSNIHFSYHFFLCWELLRLILLEIFKVIITVLLIIVIMLNITFPEFMYLITENLYLLITYDEVNFILKILVNLPSFQNV